MAVWEKNTQFDIQHLYVNLNIIFTIEKDRFGLYQELFENIPDSFSWKGLGLISSSSSDIFSFIMSGTDFGVVGGVVVLVWNQI